MFDLVWDINEPNKLLKSMLSNIRNLNKFMETKGRERLKASSKNSFRNQVSPDGETWPDSLISSPATLYKSGKGYQETQDDKNYPVSNQSIEVFNQAMSVKGFLYMQFHHFNRFPFSGLDAENTNLLNEDLEEFIFTIH